MVSKNDAVKLKSDVDSYKQGEWTMKLEIEYCSAWNYLPRAVSLTDDLLNKYTTDVKGLTLVPSGGGVFEVTLNEKLIYSKRQTGEFPTTEQITSVIDSS